MWSIERAKRIHGIGRGDLDFLDIDKSGDLVIKIRDASISLPELIERVRQENESEEGYTSTFTLRFPQLISDQVKKLRRAFASHMQESGYNGDYVPVYPVKVNQQSDLVAEILKSDVEYGLEAGSKTEMLLIMYAVLEDKNRLIVCNGTKDRGYLTMARTAAEQGHRVLLSLESIPEVKLAIESLDPGKLELALRIKPYVSSSGHWHHSGGRDSKFGLSVHDLIEAAKILKDSRLAGDVSAIHAHLGSQLTDLERNMTDYGKFMAEVFFSLRKRGLTNLETIDMGGGIPIDYESCFSTDAIPLFVEGMLKAIRKVCEKEGAATHPNIMTEAGRAVTAKSSAIIVRVVDVRTLLPHFDASEPELALLKRKIEQLSDRDALVNMWKELAHPLIPTGNLDELYSREQRIALFKKTLRSRIVEEDLDVPEDLHEWLFRPDHIAIGNFSVFNSCFDYVLVDQHFPVIPVSGHNRRPMTTVRLADMTCDSDGEISPFVLREYDGEPLTTEDTRPLTSNQNHPAIGIPVADIQSLDYFLIPLTGAYQDVLEADHNLFGDLPDVVLTVDDGEVNLEWTHGAQAMTTILDEVGFEEIRDVHDPYFDL
ncbi:hypothetical protein EU520_00400 [Candidatus Thorarchaeota archaeon]|nr:MAG: hypothetical protein EU520_00400 [Candidatus Thorarchaeota archaeon]